MKTTPNWTRGRIALASLACGLVTLLALSALGIVDTQWLFVNATYYLLMATVLSWVGTYLHATRVLRRGAVVAWLKDNWPGLAIAVSVTVIATAAVEPALRVLSDEANLVGTSKNLFASKTATFTVSGKQYYGSFWDVDVAIDRRPTLFPFLVSLIHSVRGYSHDNAFLLNLVVLPAFVLVAYRLAKSLGGETCAIVASLFVVSHPITLLCVRSAGFDFLATFFGLLVVKSWLDFNRSQKPEALALLWINLCMFAEVRYESALFIAPAAALLLLFKMITWDTLRPYAFVYAMTPVYLMPRIWQSMLRGSVPEQPPGTITLSLANFVDNAEEYFQPILSPTGTYPAHSSVLIALGIAGTLLWLKGLFRLVRARDWKSPRLRIGAFVGAWMLVQVVVVFTYVWGRAQYPSAARLVMPIDGFISLAAAWAVTVILGRWRPFVSVLLAAAIFLAQLPGAPQHRMMNRLTQSRENATTWAFFQSLENERILIVTDRPNHFTIMNYGAMSFDAAKRDPYLLTALARRLFQDIYVLQQVALSSGKPLPGYEIWPERKLEPVLEFQNDADVLVRVSRVVR